MVTIIEGEKSQFMQKTTVVSKINDSFYHSTKNN